VSFLYFVLGTAARKDCLEEVGEFFNVVLAVIA